MNVLSFRQIEDTLRAAFRSLSQVAKGGVDNTETNEEFGYIAKSSADEPLLFIASGAFQDRDGERVGRALQDKIVKAINDGVVEMTVDLGHIGFPSRLNPKPTAEKMIVGKVKMAGFENEHLGLLPEFSDPSVEKMLRDNPQDFGLSLYFGGVSKDAEGTFDGDPTKTLLSVAILPAGVQSYPYTTIS